jgi:hypothetical protein
MNNWYNSQSQSTKLLLNGFMALLASALTGALTAGYLSYTTNGFNLAAIVLVVYTTFLATFIPALYKFVPAHAAEEIAFLRSQLATLPSGLQGVVQALGGTIASLNSNATSAASQSQPGPLIHIYTDKATTIAPQGVDPAKVEQLPTQSVPVMTPQANTGYVDPLATPRTAEMPVVQVAFPGQVMTPPQ